MRILITLLCLLQMMAAAEAQTYLKKIISGTELGIPFDDVNRVQMTNIIELGERYIHFIASENFYIDGGENTGYALIYDLQEKQIINYRYDADADTYLCCNLEPQETQMPVEDKPTFVYHKGKIYHLNARTDSTILIVFDLEKKTRKFLATEKTGPAFLSAFERNGKLYFTFSGDKILLAEVSEDSITTVFQTAALRNNYIRPVFLRSVPIYHNNKLIINEVNQIRAFDFETLQLDTLLDIINYRVDSTSDDGILFNTMLSQVLVHTNDVYVVLKDARFIEPTNEYLFSSYYGDARVIKTDGTKSGTNEIFTYPIVVLFSEMNEEGRKFNTPAKLLSTDGKLYWLGANADTTHIQLYKVEDDILLPLEDLPLQNSDNSSYINDGFYTYQFDNSTNTSDIFGLYGTEEYFFAGLFSSELYLWTIKNDSVNFLMNKESIQYFSEPDTFTKDILFYPISKDSILLISQLNFFDPVEEVSSFQMIFSLLDVVNETISKLDSLPGNDLFYDFNHAGARDGDLFVSIYNTSTEAYEIWEFNLNRVSTSQEQVKYAEALFSVYPNPTSSTITVQSEEVMRGQLMIAGIDGRVYQSIPVNGFLHQVNVSTLPNGMYIALLQNGEKTGVKRLVIQR